MSEPRMIKINAREQYSLGDNLGRGAFGSVYRGLNTFSGETVAVKQIKLKKMSDTEAEEIMTEIDLLKNLNHTNIVKYHCFYKSLDSLYIVLEYCENGSLASICKTFGVFPEHLVAVFIDQVLLGLVYLHEQGVIHRDIKGANILTTKDGTVKLADFGVATNALSDRTVVGSPYWMAPEIIELMGATSASDIWSLGCVIIELLQGRPPYSDLDQMAALFHIVDDEHPPFPEGASLGAKDFLMRCFQKNPNLRTSAKKLRKHNWITNFVKRGSQKAINSTSSGLPGFDDAVTSVQEYNQKVNGPDLVAKTARPSISPEKSGHKRTTQLLAKSFATQILKHAESEEEDWTKDLELTPNDKLQRPPLRLRTSTLTVPLPKIRENRPAAKLSVGGPQIVPSQTAGKTPAPRLSTRQSMPSVSVAVRPESQKPGTSSPVTRRASPVKRLVVDDRTVRPSSTQLARAVPSSAPSTPIANRIKDIAAFKLPTLPTDADLTPRKLQRAKSGASLSRTDEGCRFAFPLQQYSDDLEDYSDIIGNLPQTPALSSRSNSARYSEKSWMQDDDVEEDPFAEIEEFEKENLTANVLREQKARAVLQMEQLVKDFQIHSTQETELLKCSTNILELLSDHHDLKTTIMSSHGLLPLLETLESSTEDDLILVILEIINTLTANDDEVQENISFVGGISSVTRFAYKKYSREIRTQSAIFVRRMLASSDLNAQIFVSCRGLGILTEFLEEDYYESRTLVKTGIEGILRVFSLQGKYTPKNDLCRVMARTGVLEPLTYTLHILISGEGRAEDEQAISSILKIMLTLAQADEYVKQLIATLPVLKRLMLDLSLMHGENLISLLKFVKSLSGVTSTLEILHHANAIEKLVQVLKNSSVPFYQEAANHALTTLFNLCRIDHVRQSEAADFGLVPILKQIISMDRPLKDMALPMLCNMAHSKECRRLLWSQSGLDFYLKILADPFWQVNAFEAIVVWFFEETARVEQKLIEPASVRSITAAFGSARAVPFESFLDQLQKLLKGSRKLSRAMCIPEFLTKLVERLNHPKPTVRANLLRILQSILDSSLVRRDLLNSYDMIAILINISDIDGAIIVRALAKTILKSVDDTQRTGVKSTAFSTDPSSRSENNTSISSRHSTSIRHA